MIELEKIDHIYLFPGLTDMRLGIFGLRKKVIEMCGMEIKSLYMFCSKNRNQVKILEITPTSTWLYQNKLTKGTYAWPMKGDKSELTKDQLKIIIEGAGLINHIESNGEIPSLF